jgi:hypothetical protein
MPTERIKIVENYKGFEIAKVEQSYGFNYSIYKNGHKESEIVLTSIEVSKKVIDVYLKRKNVNFLK